MQFRDLKKQYSVLKQDIDAAMMEVAASSAFIMGQPVKELEAGLAEYVGVKHCISCGNGTDALTLALKVWNIGAGDAVFVPDFTFFSSAEVISLEGATPVFVDVDGDTFNMDASDLERKIARTIEEGRLTPKVIITVDLFGLPANYPAIRKIADAHRLFILEDGAQGFGGMIGNKRACSFGDISTTSFFPAKPLGCLRRRRSGVYRQRRMGHTGRFLPGARQGHVRKFDNVRIGMNSRLDTLQAAILKIKFKAFREYELRDINKAAALYTRLLAGRVKTPAARPKAIIRVGRSTPFASIAGKSAMHFRRASRSQGIPSMVYYPTPMHGQTAYKALNAPTDCCPTAKRLCDTVLSLPVHPYITEEEIEMVCSVILGFINRARFPVRKVSCVFQPNTQVYVLCIPPEFSDTLGPTC